MLHCHILSCNKLPSVLFSVSVVHDPAIKESFLKDINMKQMDTHLHFQIHAALSCFLSHLCLLFSSLFSFSLLFWSLFPLCSHPDIPNCSPKRQILCCQLILAFLPRMEAKGHRKPLSMLLLFGDTTE